MVGCFVVLLFSCSDRSNSNQVIFQALDESLVASSGDMMRSSEMICASFKEKLTDPIFVTKAEIWYPKAVLVQKHATEMRKYIEGLKVNLQKGKTLDAIQASELYDRLVKYKTDLLKIDPKITTAFDSVLIITTRSFDSDQNTQKNFAKTFFSDISPEATMSVLSMFQYNVVTIENRMIRFCYEQPSQPRYHEWVNAIVGQNGSYVRAGEKIEITAGVGSFNSKFEPVIVINGKEIQLNETGIAVTSFSASRKPGQHFVPVEITYTDQDGKQQTIAKTVEYTVAKD